MASKSGKAVCASIDTIVKAVHKWLEAYIKRYDQSLCHVHFTVNPVQTHTRTHTHTLAVSLTGCVLITRRLTPSNKDETIPIVVLTHILQEPHFVQRYLRLQWHEPACTYHTYTHTRTNLELWCLIIPYRPFSSTSPNTWMCKTMWNSQSNTTGHTYHTFPHTHIHITYVHSLSTTHKLYTHTRTQYAHADTHTQTHTAQRAHHTCGNSFFLSISAAIGAISCWANCSTDSFNWYLYIHRYTHITHHTSHIIHHISYIILVFVSHSIPDTNW